MRAQSCQVARGGQMTSDRPVIGWATSTELATVHRAKGLSGSLGPIQSGNIALSSLQAGMLGCLVSTLIRMKTSHWINPVNLTNQKVLIPVHGLRKN